MTTLTNKLLAILLLLISTSVHAQRNIEFVIPFAPGGSADHIALSLLGPMREELAPLGINPVMTHRPGAGSTIGTASVANSDKLQIFMAPIAVVSSAIVNSSTINYNIKSDLIPLGYIGHVPSLLVTNSNNSIKTFQDLVKECQKRPISYGTAGVGSISHIMAASVLLHVQCKGTHVPYKGVGPAVADLQGQHIDLVVDFLPSIQSKVEANIVRPLLIIQQNRHNDFSSIPAMSDLGYKSYEISTWFVLAVGNKVPPADVATIQPAVARLFHRPDVIRELQKSGLHSIGKKISSNFFEVQYEHLEKIIKTLDLNAK